MEVEQLDRFVGDALAVEAEHGFSRVAAKVALRVLPESEPFVLLLADLLGMPRTDGLVTLGRAPDDTDAGLLEAADLPRVDADHQEDARERRLELGNRQDVLLGKVLQKQRVVSVTSVRHSDNPPHSEASKISYFDGFVKGT